MANKLNLNINTIYNKQFNVDFKGYSAQEVDEFLDQVLEDYQTYQEIAVELNKKAVALEKKNAELQAKIMELSSKQKLVEEGNNLNSQVDIIKRITRLENEVFKK